MSRLALLTLEHAPAASAPLLDQVQAAFGATPNMFRAVANSPAALASMWAAFGALGGGTLGARLGEQIAVAIADLNNCEYCLAAHTALGRKAGASSADMRAAQAGQSDDPKSAAALRFALAVVGQRGQVDAAEVDALRRAGFGDGEIMEIMAHIALNLFTNYVNVAFAVPLDFPNVALRAK
ncbi:carboxymuconolactone decarboxylase family protein [Massilia genomosp. 1]|uniref:Carboxymuconolactone decarboxylase n=1 Tax=Massilia genomosp. 1 TaxID=2609280 RepID=A0ABX0MYG5_9BURK|nr:carboxymuconolactone decarboxylase family protein [Massilia genomosp. 1]NHZ64657.1 carboxymuconolactone decarboxylase [Massilia genomosp. 1]